MTNLKETIDFLHKRIPFRPVAGIVLGTGLNKLGELIQDPIIIPYEEIPGFVRSTAPSHQGRLIAGTLGGKSILIFQGRYHFYEGYAMSQVVYPIRVLKLLGAEILVLTNAAGSLNENFTPGKLVLLKDHINFMGTNPLIGKNLDELGERFPSMHQPYSERLRTICHAIAYEHQFALAEGVYTAVSGPSLETRAECLMFSKLGSDLVGMSTVPETIAAVHAGMEVLAISVVTNLSNIFHSAPHSQEQIREHAARAEENLKTLIIHMLQKI